MKKLNLETGEVEDVVLQGAGRINQAKTAIDCSNEYEDIYEEVPPFAIDAETGEILNKTSLPIFMKTGKVNVQEKIQSYAADCDIYKILERFAAAGCDPAMVNRRIGSFGDFIDIPDNVNDFDAYITQKIKETNSLDPALQQAVTNDKVSQEDLDALVQKYVQAEIIKQTQTTQKEGAE